MIAPLSLRVRGVRLRAVSLRATLRLFGLLANDNGGALSAVALTF